MIFKSISIPKIKIPSLPSPRAIARNLPNPFSPRRQGGQYHEILIGDAKIQPKTFQPEVEVFQTSSSSEQDEVTTQGNAATPFQSLDDSGPSVAERNWKSSSLKTKEKTVDLDSTDSDTLEKKTGQNKKLSIEELDSTSSEPLRQQNMESAKVRAPAEETKQKSPSPIKTATKGATTDAPVTEDMAIDALFQLKKLLRNTKSRTKGKMFRSRADLWSATVDFGVKDKKRAQEGGALILATLDKNIEKIAKYFRLIPAIAEPHVGRGEENKLAGSGSISESYRLDQIKQAAQSIDDILAKLPSQKDLEYLEMDFAALKEQADPLIETILAYTG